VLECGTDFCFPSTSGILSPYRWATWPIILWIIQQLLVIQQYTICSKSANISEQP